MTIRTFEREVGDTKNPQVLWRSAVLIHQQINWTNDPVTQIQISGSSNDPRVRMSLAVAFAEKCPGIVDPQKIAWPTNINPLKQAKHYRDAPEFETANLITIDGVNRAIYEVHRAKIIATQVGIATMEQLNAYFEAIAKVADIGKLQKTWERTGTREIKIRNYAKSLLQVAISELTKMQEEVEKIAKNLAQNEELQKIMNEFVQDRIQSE